MFLFQKWLCRRKFFWRKFCNGQGPIGFLKLRLSWTVKWVYFRMGAVQIDEFTNIAYLFRLYINHFRTSEINCTTRFWTHAAVDQVSYGFLWGFTELYPVQSSKTRTTNNVVLCTSSEWLSDVSTTDLHLYSDKMYFTSTTDIL